MRVNCSPRKLSRRLVWALLLIVAALVGTSPGGVAAAPNRPNVVFILIDDLRWDAMSCTGHPFVNTPNIDRLAREGATFRNAFVTTPLCSPSRASFLTGQYVHRHGIQGNGNNNAVSHQLVTFPRVLQQAGYETAYIGKWHMGNDATPRPGFDRWISFRGQGAHLNPLLNIDGQETATQGYAAELFTDHAVEFIQRPRDKPFLLYLSHKAVHGPFVPAERHRELFADREIPRAPNCQDTLEGKLALRRPVGNLPPVGPGTGSGDDLIRNQLRMLMAVDESVGRLLSALEQTKQLDDTLIIFTSDNGYFWGEHGLGDKRWAYEESIRIPLLMRCPRLIKPGTTLKQMVLNVDIAPTLLELGGASLPDTGTVHGRSLASLIRRRRGEWRKSALFEYFAEPQFPRTPTWQSVRAERWKYVHYPDLEGMDELYDLKNDPHEMKNLIDHPGAKAALAKMRSELERLVEETG